MDNIIAESNKTSMSRRRLIIFATVLIAALVLVPASAAFAHSPIFPEDNHR